ncbi:hypothetical protein HJD18_08230 [Thermoleophilia bacterium SCSIO 60948]|nr:hypothetical protein HJD18_08230 [Thermoleophilia bacterium SCSIO 60948]
MVVLTLGDGPALKSTQSYPSRRNNQLANNLSFPMVSFPIGFDSKGLPISAQFKGPRFSEPSLVQAMIDYQKRYPEYHRALAPDPEPKDGARRLSPQRAQALAEEDPALSQDPLISAEALAR